MARPAYWTEERIRELASSYEYISDFARENEGAYGALKTRFKHLKKQLFPVCKKLIWTKEKLIIEAKKYSSRSDFRNGSLGAYSRAIQIGVLDEICIHMTNGRLKGNFDLGKYLDISGLYFLLKDGNVIYIGKSESCMVSRIRWHYEDKDFDEVRLHPIASVSDIVVLEAYLIAKSKPVHNIEFKSDDELSFEIANTEDILGEPIIVTASFGVNGVNSYKGKD